MLRKSSLYLASFLLSFSLFITSCKKDAPTLVPGTSEAINRWVNDQMQTYYYWSTNMPKSVPYSLSPTDYFQQLLVPQDRFSSILQAGKPDRYGNTLLLTFGFDFIQLQESSGTLSLISHVVPGSEGDRLGLQRGDTLQQIDQKPLTAAFPPNWEEDITRQNQVLLELANGNTYTLPASYISQPVVYPADLTPVAATPNVGYLFLSHFDFSGAYDLLRAVEKLRAAGKQDLIVDLRYNTGGSVAFAAFTALALARVEAEDVFVDYRGNGQVKDLRETFAQALSRQPDGYSFQGSEVRQSGLGFERLAILTTDYTASASEMLINNLKPYIWVIHIGEKTFGKDMASTTLTTPPSVAGTAPNWHISPLIYKIYNATGQGDYPSGIAPTTRVSEYSVLPLHPFGDQQDPLVAEAIRQLAHAKSAVKSMAADSENPNEPDKRLLYQSAPRIATPIIIPGATD